MKKLKIIIPTLCLILFSGCASDGLDVLSFVPGGSTYKHVKNVRESAIDDQISGLKNQGYDEVDLDLQTKTIGISQNGEKAQVDVNFVGIFSAISEDGGGLALLWDTLKSVIYGLAINEATDSGSSKKKTPTEGIRLKEGDVFISDKIAEGREVNARLGSSGSSEVNVYTFESSRED